MHRERLPYLLIPIAAFVAVIPLLIHGCSCGHDFDFHLLNWMEAARQFTHGNLHPHWAYTPAWNAGEPRFVFYPPLSWIIGAILGLIFPWTWTPILYTWLSLTAAGLAAYYLARNFTTGTAALIAATLYTVNPYMLFTAYERTAYAELLAAAWIPLLLHAILRDKVTIPRIAIPIALLWLTNAPAAVMSCYALALLTLIRLVSHPSRNHTLQSNSFEPTEIELGKEKTVISTEANHIVNRAVEKPASPSPFPNAPTQTRLQLALTTIAGTILGLGLAAFYILPAAYERRYVQIAMAIIPSMRIQDNFLFHRTGNIFHDQVLHTASLIAVILIAVTAIGLAISFFQSSFAGTSESSASTELERDGISGRSNDAPSRPKRSKVETPSHFVFDAYETSSIKPLLLPLTILTIAITLLLTPLTAFVWNHAPELAFLQFPWRLLAVLAAVLCLTIAMALTPLNLKPLSTTILAIVMAAVLTIPAYPIFHQACDTEDTIEARLALFQSNQGTEPTDEYTPTTADNDSLAQTNPPYWFSTDPNAKAPLNSQPAPAPMHITLNAPIPEDIILNLRDYPSWHITINGNLITSHTQRQDGLITGPIPAGPSTIDITYTQTLDQTLGDTISLASLAFLSLLTLRKR
jgi:hypothetical protein